MDRLKRRRIPSLEARVDQPGEGGVLQRSYPVGRREFFRIYQGEPLRLEVSLAEGTPASRVALHTDLNVEHPGTWHDIPFENVGGGKFRFEELALRCGLYRFKIKYARGGGQGWFLDRAPFSYVQVDPVSLKDIRMYTLIPTASGSVARWKEWLQHAHAMNFNTVHLLPITAMGRSESPYSARDLFDLDSSYHDPGDERDGLGQFEDFVEKAKKLGLRLCLDLVLNHVSPESQLALSRPEWIVPDENEPDSFKRAGCWHQRTWIRWEDLVLVHYAHPQESTRKDIWRYMIQYALFWANYAAHTGGMVRFDNLHSSHEVFIGELTKVLRREYPSLVILAEYFTDPATLERMVAEWGLNLLVATPWEYTFAPQLREYISHLHKNSAKLRHLLSATSHDSGAPAEEFFAPRAALPRHAISTLFGTGQAGLVQGVEFATPRKVQFIGRNRPEPPNGGEDYRDLIARLNDLMARHEVFRSTGNLRFIDDGHHAILAAHRYPPRAAGEAFLVFANLDIHNPQTITVDLGRQLPEHAGSAFEDVLAARAERTEEGRLAVTLEPCGVKILKLMK